jgi:hydroxymethylpyrimidine/phosphomethylpyrimidine kinase
MNPAPAQKLPEDLYQYIDCLIMNESEADILREAKEELKDEDLPQISEAFFSRGVPDLVVITLGASQEAQDILLVVRQKLLTPPLLVTHLLEVSLLRLPKTEARLPKYPRRSSNSPTRPQHVQ